MGGDSSGEKVVATMTQLVLIHGADFTDGIIANIVYYISLLFYMYTIV